MKCYRITLYGHRLEARVSDWGSEEVLVDGRIVSHRAVPWLRNGAHHFDVTDEGGDEHHVEMRRVDLSKLGLGKYRMLVLVDGAERARLEPDDPAAPLDVCRHCGYALTGQPAAHGEVRCPECGRHTPDWRT